MVELFELYGPLAAIALKVIAAVAVVELVRYLIQKWRGSR